MASNQLLLDPTHVEVAQQQGGLLLATMSSLAEVCVCVCVWRVAGCDCRCKPLRRISLFDTSSPAPLMAHLNKHRPSPNPTQTRPQVTQMVMSGSWSGAQSREAIELALGGCGQVRTAMRDVLVDQAERQQEQQRRRGGAAELKQA